MSDREGMRLKWIRTVLACPRCWSELSHQTMMLDLDVAFQASAFGRLSVQQLLPLKSTSLSLLLCYHNLLDVLLSSLVHPDFREV